MCFFPLLNDGIMSQVRRPVMWAGDFNAHSPLFKCKDKNGALIEDFLDKYSLVVPNDGRPTRFQVGNGKLSCIDLTFASAEFTRCGEWDLMDRYTMGSDHFPILSWFGRVMLVEKESIVRGFNSHKANWDKFEEQLSEDLGDVISEGSVDEWTKSFCSVARRAVEKSIQVKGNRKERKIVPWWNKACNVAVLACNRAYRQLRKSPTEGLAIEYKRLRVEARKIIKGAKKGIWRRFCSNKGTQTTVKQVWNMIHRMAGINRGLSIPVLVEGNKEVISNREKADLLVRTFQGVHSTSNAGREGQLRREKNA